MYEQIERSANNEPTQNNSQVNAITFIVSIFFLLLLLLQSLLIAIYQFWLYQLYSVQFCELIAQWRNVYVYFCRYE